MCTMEILSIFFCSLWFVIIVFNFKRAKTSSVESVEKTLLRNSSSGCNLLKYMIWTCAPEMLCFCHHETLKLLEKKLKLYLSTSLTKSLLSTVLTIISSGLYWLTSKRNLSSFWPSSSSFGWINGESKPWSQFRWLPNPVPAKESELLAIL